MTEAVAQPGFAPAVAGRAPSRRAAEWRLALTFARRELRSGVAGFRIFILCLALGVAAIAAAGSTAEAFRRGLAGQARELLGGDLSMSVEGRLFTAAERAAFADRGPTTGMIRVRAMAQAPSGARRLVDVRGVDAAFPLVGRFGLEGAPSLAAAGAVVDGVPGAAVEQALLDRLNLRIGDRFLVGSAPFVVRAVLTEEPDRLARGFALGPRVIVSRQAVERAGLIEPGGLYGETVRVALPRTADLEASATDLRRQFPGNAFRIRDRNDAAAGFRRMVDRIEWFLSFIGLAALVAGGLGVQGAVSSYLETRKPSIAVLKALGASGRLVRDTYLLQIAVLAGLGVAAGMAVGAAAPFIIGWVAEDRLPIPALFALYPWPLAEAAAFGLCAAAAFSLAPLARARTTPPSSLFRRDLSGALKIGPETIGAALAALGLAALTLATAPSRITAAAMLGGVAWSFVVLWALGLAAVWAAKRLRRFARGPALVGLANLAGPRSAARTASPAIGLGVALLTSVVLIQSSLLAQITEQAPRTAPALIFTEIPAARAAAFDAEVAAALGPLTPDRWRRAPFVTGRITRVRGAPVNPADVPEDRRWVFDADLSLSAIGPEPPDARMTEGRWWPADYRGPPLVILDEDFADDIRLKLGDSVTLLVLGREIEARLAGFRQNEWGEFGTSFPVILNPSALAGANLQNVAIAMATPAQESAVLRRLGVSFPEVNVISVRDQLQTAERLFEQLAWAVRGAAAIAAAAGLLVLAGALTAGARARAKEAAILKVLGGVRAQVLTAYLVEYACVGLIAGLAAAGLGVLAAWPVVTQVFEAPWSVDWSGLGLIIAGVALVTGLGGVGAAFAALSQRPAPVLRAE